MGQHSLACRDRLCSPPSDLPVSWRQFLVIETLSSCARRTRGFPGSEFGPSQAEKRSRAGHLLIALDVEVSQPRAAFEARNDGANRRDGLLLPADTLADLAKLAGELSIDALGTPA